jgi:hypothetical protein
MKQIKILNINTAPLRSRLFIWTAALGSLTSAWAQPSNNGASHEDCLVDCAAACCAGGHHDHIHDDPAPISLMDQGSQRPATGDRFHRDSRLADGILEREI